MTDPLRRNAGRFARALGACAAIALAALPAAGTAQTASTPAARTPIRIAYVPVATWLPAWVAQDKGYFAAHGLEATLTPIQNLSLLPSTVGRQFEFAASTPPDLIKAAASGLDVVAVAGEVIEKAANPMMQVMVRPNSGIAGPADLKGRIIATPTLGAVMHLATLHWLKVHGVDPASVRAVEVPFPNMGDQLKAGRVDATESLQPFVGQLTAAGNTAIGDPLLSVADPVLFTFWMSQGAWARSHKPVIASYIASLRDASGFIERDPAGARTVLAKYTHLPVPVAEKIPLPTYDFAIAPAQLDVWVKTLRELGQLNATVDPAKMVVTP